jgi:hypothetical protein
LSAADPAISVGNLEIKRVEMTKSLGLLIDESLDWTAQVEHISKKVTSGLAILRRLRDTVELNTLITIYQSIIEIDYRKPPTISPSNISPSSFSFSALEYS